MSICKLRRSWLAITEWQLQWEFRLEPLEAHLVAGKPEMVHTGKGCHLPISLRGATISIITNTGRYYYASLRIKEREKCKAKLKDLICLQ